MAYPTAVNNQITDAVTQAGVTVLGSAPAMAMASLYQATAQALGNAAHNSSSIQQNAAVLAQATSTMGAATLYSLDTAVAGAATASILSSSPRGLG